MNYIYNYSDKRAKQKLQNLKRSTLGSKILSTKRIGNVFEVRMKNGRIVQLYHHEGLADVKYPYSIKGSGRMYTMKSLKEELGYM